MNEVFIDSSALFASGDFDSNTGEKISSFLLKSNRPIVTTNYIFAETISLITKRVSKHDGIKFGQQIKSSHIITFFDVTDKILEEAWQLYKKYKDKDFDLIDATSFVVCKKRGIKEVLTLDRHFSQMGFKVYP